MLRSRLDKINAGKWRRKRLRPRRHQLLMIAALKRAAINYREYVCFYNKHNQLQFLDMVLLTKHGLAVILWKRKRYGRDRRLPGFHSYEKTNRTRKIEHLESKGIPYMWMERNLSSDEYLITIRRWLHALDKKYKVG